MKRLAILLLKNSCLLISGEFFSILVLISTAHADGLEEQKPPLPADNSAPSSQVIPPSPPPAINNRTSPFNIDLSIINWDKWGQAYWLNQNICREMNGNLICLSPQTTRQIRWQIPTKN